MYFTQCHSEIKWRVVASAYFGQPSAGFFFCSDFLTACCQFPRNLRTSGFGPGLLLGLLARFDLAGIFPFFIYPRTCVWNIRVPFPLGA
jgi:hypothetical protein